MGVYCQLIHLHVYIYTIMHTHGDVIPMARPWRQITHDKRTTSFRTAMGVQQEKHLEKIRHEMRSQIAFIDHVVTQMAGGADQVNAFVQYYLEKSRLMKERFPEYTDRLSKKMLLEESRKTLLFYNKRGDHQDLADRHAIDALLGTLMRSDISWNDIRAAGIEGYGANTKLAANKIRDHVERYWIGRPTKSTQHVIDQLERVLIENSQPSPCRTIIDPKSRGIKSVLEFKEPISVILMRTDMVKRKEVSVRKLEQIIKEELPWFKAPCSRFFCCGICDQRCQDARFLNNGPLPMFLVYRRGQLDRKYLHETEASRNLLSPEAAVLPWNLWLPSHAQFARMVVDAELDENETAKSWGAMGRLMNTQPHYREQVEVREVKNIQELRARLTPEFCVGVADHITSIRLGIKKINTIDQTMPGRMPPMLIFIQTFDNFNHDDPDNPIRTAVVVLSMRNDKTGWAIQEIENEVYQMDAIRDIMDRCQYHAYWSDHGGSFPTEEVGGWVLGRLAALYF